VGGHVLDGTLHPADPVLLATAVRALRTGQQRKIKISIRLADGATGAGQFAIAVANATATAADANPANDRAVFGPIQ